jgi:hypothetical protein
VGDHLEGRENRRLLIWSLIYLASWCDQFLGQAARTRVEASAVTPGRTPS